MSIVSKEQLESIQQGTSIETILDVNMNPVGYKGRFLPHVYDNYMECHRENKFANEKAELAKQGRNMHGQNKQQQEEFALKLKHQLIRKHQGEVALETAAQAGVLKR